MARPWDSKGEKDKDSSKGGATTAQARRLRQSGFKIWARSVNPNAPKGKVKTPTMKWIKDNFSMAQAGLILRELGYGRQVKKSIPKRPMMEIDKQAVYGEINQSVRNSRK